MVTEPRTLAHKAQVKVRCDVADTCHRGMPENQQREERRRHRSLLRAFKEQRQCCANDEIVTLWQSVQHRDYEDRCGILRLYGMTSRLI